MSVTLNRRTIAQHVVGRTKSTFIRAGFFVATLGIIISVALLLFHYVSLIENTVNSTRTNLVQSLVFGDSFQLQRITESIVDGKTFSSAWISTPEMDFIAGFSNSGLINRHVLSKVPSNTSKFIRHDGKILPLVYSKHELSDKNGKLMGYLLVEYPLPIIPSVFMILSSVIIFVTVASLVTFRVRKIAIEIANPIVKFSTKMELIRQNGAGEKVDDDDLPFAEIFDLNERFVVLMNSLYEAKIREEILAAQAAIAKTTQMLAHDVRKPFSMFKMIIDVVECEDNIEETKIFLRESLADVNQAMASVDGMISDVLEIGADSKLNTEAVKPETLIESTLFEIFRLHPGVHIDINYSFNHKHKVIVDLLKISRVFSNIVSNAIQAMGKGSLWFRTSELMAEDKTFTLFCLGNSGSFIPAESIPKLFDAFFTSGKKGGTGLGLAIAQKIVRAHGGKIWCESEQGKGVEFYFTLPNSDESSNYTSENLPKSSMEIYKSFELLKKNTKIQQDTIKDPHEKNLENQIVNLAISFKKKPSILIVDDESVYRNALAALLTSSSELAKHIELHFAESPDEALRNFDAFKPCLVILDVDLGDPNCDGYSLLSILRNHIFQGTICIHSNRSLPEDYKKAITNGADAVLPKPMSRNHLLKILLQAFGRVPNETQEKNLVKFPLPEFAVIDDSKIVLRSWVRRNQGKAQVYVFESPNDFYEKVQSDIDFLSRLSCVLTDFYFAEGSLGNGLIFASELKKIYDKPIFLCSNGEFSEQEIEGCVNKVLGKEVLSWELLHDLIHSSQALK
jgi:signal transduction histidine kinase/DNA-binding NarL/FixJ family response regulator